jgi:hypothetical protein
MPSNLRRRDFFLGGNAFNSFGHLLSVLKPPHQEKTLWDRTRYNVCRSNRSVQDELAGKIVSFPWGKSFFQLIGLGLAVEPF